MIIDFNKHYSFWDRIGFRKCFWCGKNKGIGFYPELIGLVYLRCDNCESGVDIRDGKLELLSIFPKMQDGIIFYRVSIMNTVILLDKNRFEARSYSGLRIKNNSLQKFESKDLKRKLNNLIILL
jgi:hypothetical protein